MIHDSLPPPALPLNSPARHYLPDRPCFASGSAIPAPSFWPLDDGRIRLTMMLPVRGEGYASAWFTAMLVPDSVSDFLNSFRLDPEGTLEALWDSEGQARSNSGLVPELRQRRRAGGPAGLQVVKSVEELGL